MPKPPTCVSQVAVFVARVTMDHMTITQFLLARIAEDEAMARAPGKPMFVGDPFSVRFCNWEADHHSADEEFVDRFDPERILRDCTAKRKIIQFHQDWPVLRTSPPKMEVDSSDPNSVVCRMTQQVEWLSTSEYVARFGGEPPTAPMLLAMAQVYSDHPDFKEEWRA